MNNYQTKILAIIISLALGGAACGINSTKAEEKSSGRAESGSVNENTNSAPQANQPKAENKPVVLSAKAIAGSYELNTYKTGREGNVSSLDVKDIGGGKINVYIDASYVYQANGAETFKEASGGGDLLLRGNTATGNITEEGADGDAPCRVTIVFTPAQAELKEADGCRFNVDLSGVYKKETKKAASKPAKKAEKDEEYIVNVPYDRMEEYMSDYENLKPGEPFTALDVPVFTEVKALEDGSLVYKDDYSLSINGETGVGESFLTSAALADELRPQLDSKAASLRVSCIIIQVNSTFDVYRTPYAIKVEGLDASGNVLWTAQGTKPRRVSVKG